MIEETQASQRRIGLTAALLSYLCWGFMPLYWNLLQEADSVEVICHRILWSLIFIPLIIILRRKLRPSLDAARAFFKEPSKVMVLALAAFFAGANWWINVIAVLTDHVVELGIGTFLTPLISVSAGVIFFREHLSKLKTTGVLFAVIGVLIMITSFGQFPWISLGVSMTWGIYGTLKKKLMLDAWVSILLEGLMMMPFALAYVLWLDGQGLAHFHPTTMPELSLALAGTGIVASFPLIFFTIAAINLPMNVLGFCQYLAPILTLMLGVLSFNEPFGWTQLLPLLFIWSGILIFLFAEVREAKVSKLG